MGLFGKKEEPTTGRLLMNFGVADFGAVAYTLDQGDSGRVWPVIGTQLFSGEEAAKLEQDPSLGPQETLQATINCLVQNALNRVREVGIPSLAVGEMRVNLDDSDGDTTVVVVGAARFLDSEWRRERAKMQGGQTFAPGPNWKK